MRRNDLWTREYDQRRFLANFSADDLNERFGDIVTNSLSLRGAPPRLATHSDKRRMGYWGRKLSHTAREFELRGAHPIGSPNLVPLPSDEKAQRASKVCAEWGVPPAGALVKYGELRHLREFMQHGRLLVRPASYYRQQDLAHAIRDDELQFSRIVAADRLPTLTVHDGTTRRIKARGVRPLSMTVTTSMATDYYLFCLSRSWDPRLFLMDPKYDAAVVIHDADVVRRVDAAVRSIQPFDDLHPFDVDYVDPVETTDADCLLPFVKHFRFAFQQEFRTAWIPTEHVDALDSVSVEIGALGRSASLVHL